MNIRGSLVATAVAVAASSLILFGGSADASSHNANSKKPPKPTPTVTSPTPTPTPQTLIADLDQYCLGADGQAPSVIIPYLENDTDAPADFTVVYLEPFSQTDVFTVPAHTWGDYGVEHEVEGLEYHVVISAGGAVISDTTNTNHNC